LPLLAAQSKSDSLPFCFSTFLPSRHQLKEEQQHQSTASERFHRSAAEQANRMTGPPSTLRSTATSSHSHGHAHDHVEDPSHQSLDEQVSPSLQQLIRLQIFTPMTLLLALGSNLVTTFAFHPNTGRISDEYETIWTPKKEFVGGYLLLVRRCCVLLG
jgi:hypothetical protein